MSLFPCGLDGQRHPGKLATMYWAWNRTDGVRKAYRQRLCIDCFRDKIVPLIINTQANGELLACPKCGTDTTHDLDPIYLTYCPPGMGKAQAELATCAVCAVEIRNDALEGAEQLEDRGPGSGGLSPHSMDQDAWAALGLTHLAAAP